MKEKYLDWILLRRKDTQDSMKDHLNPGTMGMLEIFDTRNKRVQD